MADGTNLSRLLRRIHLGGIIEEAVVDMDSCSSQAVDVTNSLFLKVATESSIENVGVVGIGNLSLVCKYLDTFKGEIDISKEGNRLIIAGKGRGNLKYLTTDPEFIPTTVEEGNIESLLEPCVVSVDLEKQACADISIYFSLIKAKAATLTFDPKTKMFTLDSGLSSEHQFNFPLGKGTVISGKAAKSKFSVNIYSEHIGAIFNVLEWPAEEPPPILLMAPEHPVIICQDEENMWAMLPLAQTADEE